MYNLLLDMLSVEMVNHICSYLDAKSLCTMSRVCHALYSVSTDSYHWKYKCNYDLQLLNLKHNKPSNYGWKYWYSEVQRVEGNWTSKKYLAQSLEGHGVIWGLFQSSPDVLHIGAHDNTIRTWDLRTGQNVHILRRISAFTNVPINYSHIYVGKDNNVMVVSDSHTCLRIFELYTTKLLYEIPLTAPNSEGPLVEVKITVMQLGGKALVYACTQHKVHIVDIATGKRVSVFEGHTQSIRCMQYDEEHGLIATGSLDHTIRVWNIKTGECTVLVGHTMSVRCLQFEARLNILISGSGDETMRGWALDTGECIKTENVGRVLALGFNGRFVVTAGTTKLIVRDITTWAPLYHIWTGPVGCLLVQDTRIIAGSKDVAVYSFDADQAAIDTYQANEASEAARNNPLQASTPRHRLLPSSLVKFSSLQIHFSMFKLILLACLFVVLAVFIQMYL